MSSFPTMKEIFDNKDVVAAMLFCVAAGFGQVLHAVKKWADGEVDCIWDWVKSSPRRTVGAVLGNLIGMVAFIQTGILGTIYQVPNGWWALILFGLMNGFTSDSALNKSVRTVWTEAERTEKKV